MPSQQSQSTVSAYGPRDALTPDALTPDALTPDALTPRIYTSWQDLMELGDAWEQVLRESTCPTIFSTPEWLGTWWKAYGQGKQLVTLAFSNTSGELVGLAPLFHEKVRGGIRRLRLVGDGTVDNMSRDSDNLDLIFRSGYEEACATALVRWFAERSAWDLCELNTLPTDSPNIGILRRLLNEQGWVHTTYQRPNAAVILPERWESYLKQLPKKHAQNIQYYTRRLHRHYAVRIFKCASEAELPTYLETLFDLHQQRWNARREPGGFTIAEKRHFYAEMSQAFLRRGWLEFWLLELDGTIAAAQFAFRYGDTVYTLQEGLDPAHHLDSVGQVLRAHIIQRLIAEGVRRYDYLSGDETHKQQWGAQPGAYTDLHFYTRALSRAHLYVRMRDGAGAAKTWLRVHAPALYAVLRNADDLIARAARGRGQRKSQYEGAGAMSTTR